MTKPLDRRAARTKKALKNALLTLLKNKDMTKITVSDLSNLAEIGRGTFYLHYADPYDLLDQVENEMLEQLSFPELPDGQLWSNEFVLAYQQEVWRYVYANLETFRILCNHRDGLHFVTKMKKHSEKIAFGNTGPKSSDHSEGTYRTIYMISGMLGIFQRWMEAGAPISPDDLAQITQNIIWDGGNA